MRHWLQLSLTEGIGPVLQTRLIEFCGGVEPACEANTTKLRQIEGIGAAKAQKIYDALKESAKQVDDEIAKAHSLAVGLISREDPLYPPLLKHIPDPPAVLYVKGSLEPRDLNGIAIVGSRRCSYYGREQAERFGALLAGAGMTVVSGGARGVDSAAHRGAISHPQGRTIAVLGSGVDVPYPSENAKLFEELANRGAVMSEYPLGTPPLAENFPRRNRIVSGLSRGVLVIEADVRSGALITARQACDDHGRPVFALPGRLDNAMSAGPHKLIRDGATLATCLEDILDGLGPLPHDITQPDSLIAPEAERETDAKTQATPVPVVMDLNDSQREILITLANDPLDVDAIIERTTLPAHLVLKELTLLSLKGVVRRIEGQTYAKR
ncbi:MAG TPA: DNA-processing protein DprA [Tepidisphaeraceae bacterium]|nr:DNA-processing protein DprA [Tepidisphaeraceae bacterium]